MTSSISHTNTIVSSASIIREMDAEQVYDLFASGVISEREHQLLVRQYRELTGLDIWARMRQDNHIGTL